MDKGTAKTLDGLAKALGVKVMFAETGSLKTAGGGTANADISGNVVRIEKGNPNPVRMLIGHELTHRMQDVSPESYRAFRDYAMSMPGSMEALERTVSLYQGAKAFRAEDNVRQMAMDEVAADYAGALLEDSEQLQEFIRRNYENRTMLEVIRDFFRDLATKLTGREKAQADEAVRLLEEAIKGASARVKGAVISDKHLDLFVQTMYAGKKKGNLSTPTDEQASVNTPEANSGTIPVDSVAQRDKDGKRFSLSAPVEETRFSITSQEDSEHKKIAPGMSDNERYELLKDRLLVAPRYDHTKLKGTDLAELGTLRRSDAEKLLRKLGEEFNVFKSYANKDLSIEFTFSRSNLNESVHKQKGRYDNYAKMMTVFDQVVENAVGIEAHRERYSNPGSQLNQMYVLVGAFKTQTGLVPVLMEVKEFKDETGNVLYLTVSMHEIKEADIVAHTRPPRRGERTSYAPSASEYRIADIFTSVNTEDGDMLKYIPDGFLNRNQLAAKEEAVAKTEQYIFRKDEGLNPETGEPRFSIDGSSDKNVGVKNIEALSEQDVLTLLESVENGVYADRSYLPLRRNTPGILISEVKRYTGGKTVVKDLPIISEVKHLRQTMEEDSGSYNRKHRPHGINPTEMISIIKGMDDPRFIVLQDNGRYVEIVRYRGDKRGRTSWAVLDFNQNIDAPYINGYPSGAYNVLVTTFEPDNLEKYMKNHIKAVLYDKAKDGPERGSNRLRSSHTSGTPFAEETVSRAEQDVKPRFSITPQTDADYMAAVKRGDMETAQRMEQKEQPLADFLADLQKVHKAYARSASQAGTASMDSIRDENENSKPQFSLGTESYDWARLLRENQLLREKAEYWKDQTKKAGTRVDRKAAKDVASALERDWFSSMNRDDIRTRLVSIYDAFNKTGDWAGFRAASQELATEMIDSARLPDDENYLNHEDLRTQLKEVSIILPEGTVSQEELDRVKGSLGNNLKIREGKRPNLDEAYAATAELFPELFPDPEGMSARDKAQAIIDVAESVWTREEANPFRRDTSVPAGILTNEIMESFWDLPGMAPTMADKAEQRLNRERERGAARLAQANLRADWLEAKARAEGRRERDAALDKMRQKHREQYQSAMQAMREDRDARLAVQKEKYLGKEKARSQRQKERELRAKIMRHARDLSKKLLKPSDKQHIPQELREAVAAL